MHISVNRTTRTAATRSLSAKALRTSFGLVLGLTTALTAGACGGAGDEEAFGEADYAMGQAPGMEHVFELLATRHVPGLAAADVAGKRAVLDDAIDRMIAEATLMPGLDVAIALDGNDRLEFPPVDFNMDGVPDDVGTMIEVTLPNDNAMLASTDLAHIIGLPWRIAVYTKGDDIEIVTGVPETFTRLYLRGESPSWVGVTTHVHHQRIRALVDNGLSSGGGYVTGINTGLPGTEMTEATIAATESMMGPITPESIAPVVEIAGVSVEAVVEAIKAGFSASTVPDLNQDTVLDANDLAVLPNAFGAYINGEMSFEEMGGMMGQGFDLWNYGLTFQQWKVARVLDLSSPQNGSLYLIKLCQGFYAGTALSTGLHHMPSMPCAVAVWMENGVVKVSVLDPAFIFGYFFQDAMGLMPAPMQDLFSVFPTFVYNEMAGVVNAAVGPLGAQELLPLHSFAM